MFLRTRLKGKGKKGALSLEMMGVIAVIGAIAVSGLYYMNIMMRDNKVNNMISTLQLINTKLNEMYVNEASFAGLTSAIFAKSGNAPSSVLDSAKTGLRSPWGTLTIAPATKTTTNDTFTVTIDKIPSDVCQRLGSIVGGGTAWQSLKVGSTTWDMDANGSGLVSFLSDNCEDGSNNTLVFQARKQ